MEDNFDYFAYLKNNPLLKEEQPNSSTQPGEGNVASTDREEIPASQKYKEIADEFLQTLETTFNETSTKDELLDEIHVLITEILPPHKQEFRKVWDVLKNNSKYRDMVQNILNKYSFNINMHLKDMWTMLDDEDDLNESKVKLKELIKKTLKEMSVTGGGGDGASFTAGVGMNYATPKAFKRLKKKK